MWQRGALVSPAETLNKDVAPIGDDTEPIETPREKVELGNDEDEEKLEAEGPRAKTNPKNPTSGKKQEHEESGHAVYRNWSAAHVEGRRSGGPHRIELLGARRNNSNVSFDYLFMKQGHTGTFPILSLVKTGATCCERKGTTAYSISFLVGIIKDLGFRRILLK